MTHSILLGIPDLLLSSRVNAIARTLGIPTIPTFTPHDVLSKAHGEFASMLLMDLSAEQLDPVATIRSLREDFHTADLRIVCFMAKSDDSLKAAAEHAGSDLVVSKLQFFESLPEILRGRVARNAAQA